LDVTVVDYGIILFLHFNRDFSIVNISRLKSSLYSLSHRSTR